ncbi:hypothetical protein SB725_17215 [Pseudomonas sp. SIMBA_041]|uniref:hypothetical protein n=1 Tax=Pseudomonas sp. SIMBA_041 TaxID=3085782 RepID=UPI0039794E10
MKAFEITTLSDGTFASTIIEYQREGALLTLRTKFNPEKTYKAHDLLQSFGLLRADYPTTKFLCKGAKINVYTFENVIANICWPSRIRASTRQAYGS